MTKANRRLSLEDLNVDRLLDGKMFHETRWRPGRWHRLANSLLSSKDNDIDSFSPARRNGFYKRNSFFVAKLDLSSTELPHLAYCQHELLGAKWVRGDKVQSLLTHKETRVMFGEVLEALAAEHGIEIGAGETGEAATPTGRSRRLSPTSSSNGLVSSDSELDEFPVLANL